MFFLHKGNDERLEQRMGEHQDACRKGEERKSEVAEHAWKEHHPILWQESGVIDSKYGELRVKEALHIHPMPEDQRFNRDVGLELPGCWVPTLKALHVKPHPTIDLIDRGYFPFSMNELHVFPEPVRTSHASRIMSSGLAFISHLVSV